MPNQEPEFPSNRDLLLERPLPSSPETERAILGNIILDNDLMHEAVDLLKPEDFYVPAHKKIFEAMVELYRVSVEIDPILIGNDLDLNGTLEAVGGRLFITNLTYGLPHVTSIAQYAKVVRGKSLLRQLVRIHNKGIAEALEEEDEPRVIQEHAEKAIFDLSLSAQNKTTFSTAGAIVEQNLREARERREQGIVVSGLPTGLKKLDLLLKGLKRQNLIIIASRPSVGKTALALMISQNVSIRGGGFVAFFSLEMSRDELGNRMLCSESSIDSQRFQEGYLTDNEIWRLEDAKERISESALFIDDTPAITAMALKSGAKRLMIEQKRELDMIVVDYLQLMSGSARRFESRQQEVSQISRELKALAKELNVPMVALSQLNRLPEARTDHRPNLSDLRESGAIEQDSDIVTFLFRQDMYLKSDQPKTNIAEIIAAKNRNGPRDTIAVRFDESTGRFDNLAQTGNR